MTTLVNVVQTIGSVIGALFGAFCLLVAVIWTIEFYHHVRFLVAYRKVYLLVCTPKRGWHDFLENNVLPVLPPNVKVVWTSPQRDAKLDRRLQVIRDAHITGPTPLLVGVRGWRVRSASLAQALRPLRVHSRRDPATQALVTRALAEAIRAV